VNEKNAAGAARVYSVVLARRQIGRIRVGELVVLLPVEDVVADVALLALPTVRRIAQAGLRGVVLVPFDEWRAAFPAADVADVVN
jgi:hypothetical protein